MGRILEESLRLAVAAYAFAVVGGGMRWYRSWSSTDGTRDGLVDSLYGVVAGE